MKKLLEVTRGGDTSCFEQLIARDAQFLLSDSFLVTFIPHLRTKVRREGVKRAVSPYRRVSLSGLAQVCCFRIIIIFVLCICGRASLYGRVLINLILFYVCICYDYGRW